MGRSTCCQSFSRAAAARAAAAADAGGGPREWDASMPVPAGTGLDRRRFLLGAAGGVMSVYGAGRLGIGGRALSEGIASAAERHGPGSPILVSIFLAGGLDALSVLGPAGDTRYRSLRPSLAIREGHGSVAVAGHPALRWSPAAAPLASLYDAGKLIVMPGSGYLGEDMSHFTSRHYWEVGALDAGVATGWLGRYLDRAGAADNPLQGLSLDGAMNPTLATAQAPVSAIDRPETFALQLPDAWGPVSALAMRAASRLGDAQRRHPDPAIAQVAAAASEVGVVRRALAPLVGRDGRPAYRPAVRYPAAGPDDFPGRLAALAAMISAGLPLRCVALTPSTQFDTHAAQAPALGSELPRVLGSIAAFQADLEARGEGHRVLVHVWSEFGRRAQENGSGGTDHGAAGLSMLIGSRVRGGMIGEFPSLHRLDANGNQRVNVDFRGVYASLLEQWFGCDAGAVIPEAHRFARHRLVR